MTSPRRPDIPPEHPDTRRYRAEVYGELVANLFLGPRGRKYLGGRGLDADFASILGIRSVESWKEWTSIEKRLSARYDLEQRIVAGFAYIPDEGPPARWWLPWWGRVPALLIPYHSVTGQVEAIRFRRITQGDRRYMAPLGAGARIPWHAEAFDADRPLEVVVTEGELDALSLLQIGYDSVALGGATPSGALLSWVVEAVADVSRLALWVDADRAGNKAVEKLSRLLAARYGLNWVGRKVVRWRSSVDANDMLAAGQL